MSEKALEKAKLSPKEIAAYKNWSSKQEPAIALSTQAKMFELYLNGNSCEEIQRLNPGFHLGAVVSASIEGDWDARRQHHIGRLLEGIRERVQQVTLESISFAADLLSAANKKYGDRIKKYQQTGDESELGDLSISSLKQYRETVEMLMKLTGQDKQPSKTEVLHHHTVGVNPALNKPIESSTAAAILDILIKDVNE